MKTFRVATIAGDGIGKEVIPQPDSQSSKRWPLSENSFTFEFENFDWGGDYYRENLVRLFRGVGQK